MRPGVCDSACELGHGLNCEFMESLFLVVRNSSRCECASSYRYWEKSSSSASSLRMMTVSYVKNEWNTLPNGNLSPSGKIVSF